MSFTLLSCALLAVIAVKHAEGLSTKVTTYYDEGCTEATGATTLTFGRIDDGDDGNTTFSPFNECVVDSGAGSVMVCDIESEETGLIQYSDSQCKLVSFDTTTDYDCLSIASGKDFACTGNNECAHRDRCTNEVAATLIANSYNVRAIEYEDNNCTSPTGNTEVLSANLFLEKPYDGTCHQIETGGVYTKTRCLADGSVRKQTFAPNDVTCSDTAYQQFTTSHSAHECNSVMLGTLYYSLSACSTEAVSVGEGATLAPAPTPAPVAVVATLQPIMATITTSPTTAAEAQDTGGAVGALSRGRGISGTAAVFCALATLAAICVGLVF